MEPPRAAVHAEADGFRMRIALLLLGLSIYALLGVGLAYGTNRRMRPGWRRRIAVAGVLALFFGVSVLLGHGAVPAPAWLWIFQVVEQPMAALLLGLLPLLVQWALLVLLIAAVHAWKRRRSAPPRGQAAHRAQLDNRL